MRIFPALAIVPAVLLTATGPAVAFDDYVGTRSLALGGALRAGAAGDSGPLLNPSGMSLMRAYTVDAAYGHSTRRSANFFHGSIVDSTSGVNLAGGLYYTYLSTAPANLPRGHGHELGISMGLPLGEHFSMGVTSKYFWLGGDQVQNGVTSGVTYDAGVTIRPVSNLGFGVVGTNLRNLHNDDAPRTLGYGVAYSPSPQVVLAADGRTMFDINQRSGTKGTSVMGGGELFWAQRAVARLGGGYDAVNKHGYLSGGMSVISELGALDVALRRDLFGVSSDAITIVTAGFRLFVAQP